MAFDVKDYFKNYSVKGDDRVVFNVARWEDGEAPTGTYPKYNIFLNEDGSYLIQRVTTSGTLNIAQYYARKTNANFSLDVAGRASLNYVEYNQLFSS